MRKSMRWMMVMAASAALAIPSALTAANGADRARSPAASPPAPASAFESSTTIYVGSGVTVATSAVPNASIAISFHCTNVSGTTASIRYSVLSSTGDIRADIQFDVAHAHTRTVSTTETAAFREDAVLSLSGIGRGGVVNIESDQSAVFCNAMMLDPTTVVPVGVPFQLTRVNPEPAMLNRSPAATRPAPAIAFERLTTIYIGPGVVDSGTNSFEGVATMFYCTNLSGAGAMVRYLVLNHDGSIVADRLFNLGPARTHAIATHIVGVDLDEWFGNILINQGVGQYRVESIGGLLHCPDCRWAHKFPACVDRQCPRSDPGERRSRHGELGAHLAVRLTNRLT